MNAKTNYFSLTVDNTYTVVAAADEAAALRLANRLFKDFEGNYGRVERATARDHRAFMKRLKRQIDMTKQEVVRLEKIAAIVGG
jgi:hypothetical protein